MALIRPRLTDYHDLALGQEQVDFAIPFLDEDIPYCLDPFLLWKSPSQQDNALYAGLINSFNHLGYLVNRGKEDTAASMLVTASECNEVGLGFSGKRTGHRISTATAKEILSLFRIIPEIKQNGFLHFEEIQLYVDQVSRDRIGDIACSYLKSFLIDFTIDQCSRHNIPTVEIKLSNIWDLRKNDFNKSEQLSLPINPETKVPILLVPKRWLRKVPWINVEDYIKILSPPTPGKGTGAWGRVAILNFNRQNYGAVQAYVKRKERTAEDCRNDPLFAPIPVLSAKRKLAAIKKLPTGKGDNADKKYEAYACQLLASLLYPYLDFSGDQVRTESGAQIRDIIFYNNRSIDFMQDIYQSYGSRQIVFELKNVATIDRYHLNQLNRYLSNEFGRFGIIFTRNRLPPPMFANTIDLWSGQRRCIIALTDEDLSLMVNVYESKQRSPIEVIKKQYIEFMRACPS